MKIDSISLHVVIRSLGPTGESSGHCEPWVGRLEKGGFYGEAGGKREGWRTQERQLKMEG